jgi:nucleotidyltransferase/DNA polymerase involved in DNA repair
MLASLHLPYLATTLYAHDHALPPTYPLALIANDCVYALNSAAEQGGLHRYMSERQARGRLPEAWFHPAQPLRDAEVLAQMMDCIAEHTDTLDPTTSPQMPHLLMEMPVRKREDQIDLAQHLGRAVREATELAPALAIAPAVFTVRTAASLTPVGNVRYIEAGRERTLLAPLPVALLPLEANATAKLHRLGITTIGQFAALPAGSVVPQFGTAAKTAYDIARGQDPARLRPRLPPPAIELIHPFEDPVTYLAPLEAVLNQLGRAVSEQLYAESVSASVFWLVVHTESRAKQERRITLRDPIRDVTAIREVLIRLLRQIRMNSGVVELRVIVQGLGIPFAGAYQMGFLDHLHPKGMLARLFPRLVERYGHSPFWRVVFRDERTGYPLEQQFDLVPF